MKGLAAARQGREPPRAGKEGGWCVAAERSRQHPGQSKHHVSGPGGKQKMAPVTGDVPDALRIFSQSPSMLRSGLGLFFRYVGFIGLIFPGVLPGKKVEWSKAAGL